MRNTELLKFCENALNDNNHSFLSYNSLAEESFKIASYYLNNEKQLIIIKENNYLASRLKDHLLSYFNEDELLTFLPEESMRAEEIASSFENRAERVNALYRMISDKNIKIVITSPYGFSRHLPNKEELKKSIIHLKVGEKHSRDDIVSKLREIGYEKTSHIEAPMSYATRGYILDVYSINYDKPIRIEFFDDEIDSIRFFDIDSKQTIEKIEDCTIIFSKDVFFSDEDKQFIRENITPLSGEMEVNLEYLLTGIYTPSQYFYYSYFEKNHLCDYFTEAIIYVSNEEKSYEHIKVLTNETVTYIQEMHSENKLPLHFYMFADFRVLIRDKKVINGQPFGLISSFSDIDIPYGSLEYIINLVNIDKHQYKLVILQDKELEQFINTCNNQNVEYSIFTKEFKKGLNVCHGHFFGGFELDHPSIIIYSEKELFRRKSHRGRFATRYAEAININSVDELKAGDYVVHDDYGIGQYISIETKNINGISSDYIRIIYRGNSELHVPLSQFSQIRKYVSSEGVVPKLHKLGSKEWKETKRKVEENVNDIAEKLIELYTSREGNIGYKFSEDNEIQREFESKFEFDLTDDQLIAIDEIKKDMCSDKPMDRLLCGDVGFGKTEVAIRAAFKAVLDGKQVAYLCPTTVLSLQHFQTFKERFKDYPVNVELINRYISKSKQKEIVENIRNGKIDILIGTHRILSNDIKYEDLGFLIVDEEQRFGVEHKEKIKELKNGIDVLSLSATPIPRTLQMSLIGIRGLSTLNTPPLNRYPVQTYVVFKNQNLIEEVIMRELERNGQVFYLFNNTMYIHSIAKKLQDSLPYAKIDVVHGKMSSEEIEDAMYHFYNNETNVLLCTTIIETGLDIPNANTIIVEDAQNFGLSQLYQIKGRVGRSDRVAYAYFLIPEKKNLNENSLKRLEAIKEFTALGSGYKIAMRDLTIRGAGDLLGSKQSGFINNVGFDLYLSMLEKAIKIKKGEEAIEEEKKEVINIPISSYIPENFTENDLDKLNLYQDLDKIENKEDLFNYYLAVTDEYGRLPESVAALFDKKKLELLINMNHIDRIVNREGKFIITLTKDYSDIIDGYKLFEYCNDKARDINISYRQSKLMLSIDNRKESIDIMLKLIDNLENLVKDENR